MKMGRPKEHKENYSLKTIYISNSDLNKLDKYCKENKLSRGDAIGKLL
jgi:hypothetical protein